MCNPAHIGFPGPLLGMKPVRLPVLFDDGERIVIEKPQGVLVQQDSWYPRLPVLIEAIRYQAEQGKPEFARLGIGESGLWAVTDLDPECSGPVLFTRSKEVAEELRNAFGSRAFGFTFQFLSVKDPNSGPVACDLPIARHGRLPKILVSHTTGKKAQTEFHPLGRAGRHLCLEARTHYPRRHQILLHAAESGFPVLGDRVYARSKPLLLSQIKKGYRAGKHGEERPLFEGPACFLRELTLENGLQISASPPSRWTALLKQLSKYSA